MNVKHVHFILYMLCTVYTYNSMYYMGCPQGRAIAFTLEDRPLSVLCEVWLFLVLGLNETMNGTVANQVWPLVYFVNTKLVTK